MQQRRWLTLLLSLSCTGLLQCMNKETLAAVCGSSYVAIVGAYYLKKDINEQGHEYKNVFRGYVEGLALGLTPGVNMLTGPAAVLFLLRKASGSEDFATKRLHAMCIGAVCGSSLYVAVPLAVKLSEKFKK